MVLLIKREFSGNLHQPLSPREEGRVNWIADTDIAIVFVRLAAAEALLLLVGMPITVSNRIGQRREAKIPHL